MRIKTYLDKAFIRSLLSALSMSTSLLSENLNRLLLYYDGYYYLS